MGSDTSGQSLLATFRRLERSHAELVGERLVAPGTEEARESWLYAEAPFGLLAHDDADDPRFIYANRTAQRWFDCEWDDLVGQP